MFRQDSDSPKNTGKHTSQGSPLERKKFEFTIVCFVDCQCPVRLQKLYVITTYALEKPLVLSMLNFCTNVCVCVYTCSEAN
jgi:hypothetical protein